MLLSLRTAGKATVQLLSIVPKPGEALMSGVIAQTFTDVDLRTVPALTLWRSVRPLLVCTRCLSLSARSNMKRTGQSERWLTCARHLLL